VRLNKWVLLRFGVLAFAGYCGFSLVFPSRLFSLGDISFFFAVGIFGSRYWVFRSYARLNTGCSWLAPSWSENPFQKDQPFQFFHLAAWAFVALSLVALIHRFESALTTALFPAEAIFGAFGLGLLLGIKWAVMSHKGNFNKP
jgi:hypothetical protein